MVSRDVFQSTVPSWAQSLLTSHFQGRNKNRTDVYGINDVAPDNNVDLLGQAVIEVAVLRMRLNVSKYHNASRAD